MAHRSVRHPEPEPEPPGATEVGIDESRPGRDAVGDEVLRLQTSVRPIRAMMAPTINVLLNMGDLQGEFWAV